MHPFLGLGSVVHQTNLVILDLTSLELQFGILSFLLFDFSEGSPPPFAILTKLIITTDNLIFLFFELIKLIPHFRLLFLLYFLCNSFLDPLEFFNAGIIDLLLLQFHFILLYGVCKKLTFILIKCVFDPQPENYTSFFYILYIQTLSHFINSMDNQG